jgi:intein/homing endonuclease
MQYDTMDMDSEVNAALDIIAEFCTQKDKENETPFHTSFRGQPTSTEVKLIKDCLQKWCKQQQFETRIFRIVRNTFKYGDCFFLRDPETKKWLYVDPVKVSKIIANESEGKIPEQYVIKDINFNFKNLIAVTPHGITNTSPSGTASYTSGGSLARGMVGDTARATGTRFQNAINEIAVDAKDVVHISLSEGLDNNFPFGNSLLESVFKVYKQKELLEDAVIIYRVQRAPERRIFYVDVGNMPAHMAMGFVERVKNEIQQRRIPSSTGGSPSSSSVDSSYNPISTNEDYFLPKTCLHLDTAIKLLDDRTLTLAELITEYEAGKDNYAYTVNQSTHEIEPGKIVWAGITRKNAELVEVLLDNGETIKCTPDHRFIMRDGSEVEAQHLQADDSLMPLYLHDASTGKFQGGDKYLRYTCPATGKKKWVHTMVCPKQNPGKTHVIHHINCNSRDNYPTNLIEMEAEAHRQLHSTLASYHMQTAWQDPVKREKIMDGITKRFANCTPEERAKFVENGRINGAVTWTRPESVAKVRAGAKRGQETATKNKTIAYSDGMAARIVELYNEGFDSISKLKYYLRDDAKFQQEFFLANPTITRDKHRTSGIQPTDTTLTKIAQHMGYVNWDDFKKTYRKNHKVVSVTWLVERVDTGDITIESASDSHNFATAAGVFIHNSEGRGSSIETLPGGCLEMSTLVPLTDGRTLSLTELTVEYKAGKENWAYSANPETGEIVPGLISWAGVTQESAIVMRLTINTGDTLICTPDHKFPIIGKGDVRADELVIGEVFIPHQLSFSDVTLTNIEYLDERIQVGTLTIDEFEDEHSYHNFALSIGFITKNSNLGEISDLRYFTNKLFRSLRIPASYLPTGIEEASNTVADGKVGTAYIQEFRFNEYCKRLQNLLVQTFDLEFKLWLYSQGINIDSSLFELKFNEPQNFAAYRQSELDTTRVNIFAQLQEIPYLSKRFAMKRFLGMTQEEITENEAMWREENGHKLESLVDGAGELRSAGISPSGIASDMSSQDEQAPEGVGQGPEGEAGGIGSAPGPMGNAAPGPTGGPMGM